MPGASLPALHPRQVLEVDVAGPTRIQGMHPLGLAGLVDGPAAGVVPGELPPRKLATRFAPFWCSVARTRVASGAPRVADAERAVDDGIAAASVIAASCCSGVTWDIALWSRATPASSLSRPSCPSAVAAAGESAAAITIATRGPRIGPQLLPAPPRSRGRSRDCMWHGAFFSMGFAKRHI